MVHKLAPILGEELEIQRRLATFLRLQSKAGGINSQAQTQSLCGSQNRRMGEMDGDVDWECDSLDVKDSRERLFVSVWLP